MISFSDRLKELRKGAGLSQKALGEDIGASERSIQSYELGTRKPTLDVINKLADYFGVTTDYLLGRTNHWLDAEGRVLGTAPPSAEG